MSRADLLGDLAKVNQPLFVNQVDEADRRTAKEYAAEHEGTTEEEIKTRYAATGDFECGRSTSQANVTIKDDIITTSAHSVNPFGCIDGTKPAKCVLYLTIGGQRLRYEANQVIDSGQTCGAKPAGDWAILKLSTKVDPRIKPYGFDRRLPIHMRRDNAVVAIGKSYDYPNTKEKDLFKHPKHYGDCQIKGGTTFTIYTTCDLSPGSSGGALLTAGPDPFLYGVHASEILGGPDCPKYNAAKRSGAYSLCWANESTIVGREFGEALSKIAAETKQ